MDAISADFHSGIARRNRFGLAWAAFVVGWWAAAALLVVLCDRELVHAAPGLSVTIKALAIFAAAAAFMHFAPRHATTDHAFIAGSSWLLLSIISEVALTFSSGHEWHALIGSTAHHALRDILLLSWVVAPVVFARHRSADCQA